MAKKNISYVSLVKLIAAFAVVMVHTSMMYVTNNDFNAKWWTGNIFDSISRIGVPLYFMITGAVFLYREEPAQVFYKKRAKRIIPALVIWSLVYYVFIHVIRNENAFQIQEFVIKLLTDNHYYHLWNLYAFILLYLTIPILQKAVKYIPTSYIIFYALMSGGLVTLNSFYWLLDWSLPLNANPFVPAVAYVLLGYAIAHRDLRLKRMGLYALGGALFIIFSTYFSSQYLDKFHSAFYNRYGLPVMVYATGVFMGCRWLTERYSWITSTKVVSIIASSSFGIYLIHPLLIRYWKDHLSPEIYQTTTGLEGLLFLYILVFLSSLIIISILQKIPYLNKII